MIDIHSHIISGIDDGSKSLEMTINMLKCAKNSGINGIVATPHFMIGRFTADYEEVTQEVEKLKKISKKENIDIEIYSGQEIFYSNNILEYYLDKMIGTINNSKYMLIELPMLECNLDEVINNLYELQIRGIIPIIAHPERYKFFIKKPHLINKFIDEGCLFQVNSGSISGNFGKEIRKTANIFIENNIYSFIGSDGHRDEGRNTNMTAALELINEDMKKQFEENSYYLVNNKDIKFDGNKIKEKKKIFGIF